MAIVSKSEYAALKGWTRPYISKLLREGRISQTSAGMIDVDMADAELDKAHDPTKDGVRLRHARERTAKHVTAEVNIMSETNFMQEPANFYAAKAQRESYLAKLAQLEYEKLIGQVVDAEEVRNAAYTKARIIRDRLQAIPDRMAPILAAESDPAKVHDMINAEIRLILDELAHGEHDQSVN